MALSEMQAALFKYRETISEKAWDWMKLCGAANTSGLLAIGVAISGLKDKPELLHDLKYPGIAFLVGILLLTCAFLLFSGFYILDKQAELRESLEPDDAEAMGSTFGRYRGWQLRNRLGFATIAILCGALSVLSFAIGLLASLPLFAAL